MKYTIHSSTRFKEGVIVTHITLHTHNTYDTHYKLIYVMVTLPQRSHACLSVDLYQRAAAVIIATLLLLISGLLLNIPEHAAYCVITLL